mmetsp:Transcript_3748/g.7826  ORF Transcript_3748/g.7826 Transcript_3748/m.7826 type:complete len:150 (+) Transcript_3748:92-541(+)
MRCCARSTFTTTPEMTSGSGMWTRLVNSWMRRRPWSTTSRRKKLTSRDDLGLPLPPTDLKLKAIAKIQRSTAAQASKQEAAKAEKEQATPGRAPANKRLGRGGVKEEVDVDLGNVDVEFLNYKGLVMTKKQKAAFAARAAKAKKKQDRR